MWIYWPTVACPSSRYILIADLDNGFTEHVRQHYYPDSYSVGKYMYQYGIYNALTMTYMYHGIPMFYTDISVFSVLRHIP